MLMATDVHAGFVSPVGDCRKYNVCAGGETDEASDFKAFDGCNLVAGNILVFALGKVPLA